MHFTLLEAAERAKMPSHELLDCIERDELMAERSSEDAQYRISAEALEAFLSKKSFETFWNNTDEADNEAVEKKSSAQSGNLRRVLTAEAVAELKIEHQVLMSRVETLERLFSEFMDMEKIEKTLVLEESWKIDSTVSHEKAAPPALNDLPISAQKEDSVVSKDKMVIQNQFNNKDLEVVSDKQEMKYDDSKSTDTVATQFTDGPAYDQPDTEKTAKEETPQQAVKEDQTKTKMPKAKPKNAKSLLTKKLTDVTKDKRVSEKQPAQESDKKNMQEDIEIDRPISVRLAEYERRLVEAKQTATQIWH